MKAVPLLHRFLGVWILIGVAWAQQCTSGFPVFDESRNYSAFTGTAGGRQLLFPSQQFTCSGIVTRISAQVIGNSTRGIDFQIWRPKNNGTYELVWGMEYSELLGGIREGNNISIEPLIQEIPVRPRDVIGLFLQKEELIGVQYENGTDTTGTVFYAEGVNGPLCNFSLCDPDVQNMTNTSPLIDVVFEPMLDPDEMELSLAGTHDRCTTTGFSSCSMQSTGVIPTSVRTTPPDPSDGRNATTMPPILTTPPPQPPTYPPPVSSEDTNAGDSREQGGDFDPVPVGMGVALGFLVAIIGVIVAVVVAVMVVQRRRNRNAACSVQLSQGERFTIYTATASTDDIPAIRNEAYAITTSQNVAYRALQPDDSTVNVQQTQAGDADGYDYVREPVLVVL